MIQAASQAQLTKTIPGEVRGSINRILKHIAGAENWYFEHLGLGLNQPQLPADPVEMLAAVRSNTHGRLMMLAGLVTIYRPPVTKSLFIIISHDIHRFPISIYCSLFTILFFIHYSLFSIHYSPFPPFLIP